MAYEVGFGSSDILAITQMQVSKMSVDDISKERLEAHKQWLKENPGYRTNPEKVKEHRELFGDLYTDKNDVKLPIPQFNIPEGAGLSGSDILVITQMQIADYQNMKEIVKQMNEAQAKDKEAHRNLLNNGKAI